MPLGSPEPGSCFSEDFIRVLGFDFSAADLLITTLRLLDPGLIGLVVLGVAETQEENPGQSSPSFLWELESRCFKVFKSTSHRSFSRGAEHNTPSSRKRRGPPLPTERRATGWGRSGAPRAADVGRRLRAAVQCAIEVFEYRTIQKRRRARSPICKISVNGREAPPAGEPSELSCVR